MYPLDKLRQRVYNYSINFLKGRQKMKKFFAEFKKFITRGNVIDMAVGVIVGGAFTAIVNSMSNNILKPLINWLLALILGKDSLKELYTYLTGPVYAADGSIDLANSIYIDWGAFINAIINFIITAFVLFIIVKIINNVRARQDNLVKESKKGKLSREQKKELKAAGIKRSDKQAVRAYFDEKARLAALKAEEEAKAAAELAASLTTDDLLRQIVELLKKK